ncbi:MAG: hypothetical protein M0Q92_07175 [Methanoregula sp.]|nr:hypothetical protein [Methanoregula sp.]
MESGDIVTLVGGLAVVLVIALISHPQYISDITVPVVPGPTVTPVLPTTVMPTQIPIETGMPTIEPTSEPVRPDDLPYQIFYSSQPFTYPRFKLPDNMVTFGASDLPLRTERSVPFAFISESRGGLTQKFSVPYPIWVINTTVIANRTPQYGNFKMVLCYADNGTIIKGDEVLNRGTSYRVVHTSNTDLYMIITTAYIDNFYISLETPRSYYNSFRP